MAGKEQSETTSSSEKQNVCNHLSIWEVVYYFGVRRSATNFGPIILAVATVGFWGGRYINSPEQKKIEIEERNAVKRQTALANWASIVMGNFEDEKPRALLARLDLNSEKLREFGEKLRYAEHSEGFSEADEIYNRLKVEIALNAIDSGAAWAEIAEVENFANRMGGQSRLLRRYSSFPEYVWKYHDQVKSRQNIVTWLLALKIRGSLKDKKSDIKQSAKIAQNELERIVIPEKYGAAKFDLLDQELSRLSRDDQTVRADGSSSKEQVERLLEELIDDARHTAIIYGASAEDFRMWEKSSTQ